MCVVSMVGDHFTDKWSNPNSSFKRYVSTSTLPTVPTVSVKEFEDLKKEVEEMKALLIKAKLYDEKNNEPHCEMKEKVALLKEVARIVGIDLNEIFYDNL